MRGVTGIPFRTAQSHRSWSAVDISLDLIERAPNRMQKMSKNLTMLTVGGRICCRQCQAKSKRTRLQCKAPAIKGKNVCRFHGGLSTGPKTAEGRQSCAEANTVHGNETRAKRAERSHTSAELHKLVDLGNAIGLFNKEVRLRGRTPTKKG